MCKPKTLSSYWISSYIVGKRFPASNQNSQIGTPNTAFVFTSAPNYNDALINSSKMSGSFPQGIALSVKKVRFSSNIPKDLQGIGSVFSDVYGKIHTPGNIHYWNNGQNGATNTGTVVDPAFNIPTFNVLSESGPLFENSLDFIGHDYEIDTDYRCQRFYGGKGVVSGSGALYAVPELSTVPAILLQISMLIETYDDQTFDKILKGC